MTRKTNPEIIAEFAALLTNGAQKCCEDLAAACARNSGAAMPVESALHITKPWRTELWKKLKECEERMCPRPPDPPPDRFIDSGTGL